MTKHDEILLRLTDEKLKKIILTKFFMNEKIGCWCILGIGNQDYGNIEGFNTKQITTAFEMINNLKKIDSIHFEKTIEYPLIKGDNQYRVTKGFLDLIVHARAKIKIPFATLKYPAPKEIIFEIKKESDFKDVGKIIRQIKEYREYYGKTCKKWESKITKMDDNIQKIFDIWCVIADKIPDKYIKLLEGERIYTVSLEDYND